MKPLMNTSPHIILLIETSNTYGRDLLRGITKYARLHGPWVFSNVPGTKLAFDINAATGMIIRDSVVADNKTTIEKMLKLRIPIIISSSLQEPEEKSFYITKDNHATGKMGAEYFISKGYKNLAFCGNNYYWSAQRQTGFVETAHSKKTSIYLYQPTHFGKKIQAKIEYRNLAKWLKSLPSSTGLLCCNDERANQVSEICKDEGIAVPEDIAILGIDNDDLMCEICVPPLSSIAFNAELAGYEAAAVLDQMIRKRKVRIKSVTAIPTHVVTRQSTDIFATEDKNVLVALNFIHKNSNRLIQVSDVTKISGLSRRGLEKRFRQILGHSIYEEILRTRMETIGRMLIDTNLSITEIADIYGYEYVNNMARPFKRITGLNLVEYRKLHQHK